MGQEDDDIGFDSAMRRAGIDVPADLRPGTLSVYRELMAMARLVRTPRPAESEPACVFRLDTTLPARPRP